MNERLTGAARFIAILGVWCGACGLLIATYLALYGGSLLTNAPYLLTATVIVLSVGLTVRALKSRRYNQALIASLPCLALILYLAGVLIYVISRIG